MYWLQPPPILRRVAAVVLVAAAIVWDLRGSATSPYPVAAAPIAAGTRITADLIEWIHVPTGVLPEPDPPGSVAAVDIEAGEPLASAMLTGPVTVPDGWWTVPIAIGTLAAPGDEVMLVVVDPPLSIVGLVVGSQIGDPFDLDHRPAAVAVPGDSAPIVASAAHQGLLVTAVRHTPPGG